jgi:hypothetical protein
MVQYSHRIIKGAAFTTRLHSVEWHDRKIIGDEFATIAKKAVVACSKELPYYSPKWTDESHQKTL